MERDYKAGTVSPQAFCEFYVSTLAGRIAPSSGSRCAASFSSR